MAEDARGPGVRAASLQPAPDAASETTVALTNHQARGMDPLAWVTSDRLATFCRNWPLALELTQRPEDHEHVCEHMTGALAPQPGDDNYMTCYWKVKGSKETYVVRLDLSSLGERDLASLLFVCVLV